MLTPQELGYAFALSLPPAEDARLRRWAEATPGATFDTTGSHVTVVRLTGSGAPEGFVDAMRAACAGVGPITASFGVASRESYWDKPGAEIVMLVARRQQDVAGILDLRERLIATMTAEGLSVFESGPYNPHVTLTTGLPPGEARRLQAAAAGLKLRFTSHEVVFWSGGETVDQDVPADPTWRVVERLSLD